MASGALLSTVMELVNEAMKSSPSAVKGLELTAETLLVEEIGLDSLDLVMVLVKIQDRLQIEIDLEEIPRFRCVNDIVTHLIEIRRASAA